jgi:hypothetical protein
MDEKFKLESTLEKTKERLVKENWKIIIFMTVYSMVICGMIMHPQYSNLKDLIIESVILGAVVSGITMFVYFFFTSLFTNKKALESSVARLKFEIEEIDKKNRDDLY